MDQIPGPEMFVPNVHDRRNAWIGSWKVEPLIYDSLSPSDVGRTVIYHDHGRAEAGTLTSWKNGIVFARYSRGDTAAGANASDLFFGVCKAAEEDVTGSRERPPYPEGDVFGPCVCGSWPGGPCLRCPWIEPPASEGGALMTEA